jgi:predicted component of type VI protein secretion system
MDPRDEDPTTQLLARVPTEPITSVGFALVVAEGPDAGGTFRIEDLAHRRVLIGKSPACEVLLTDRGVSRRHAALELEGSTIRIFDLDSSNGVWVGNTRVRDAYLQPGDTIRLGSTSLRVEIDAQAKPVAASNDTRFYKVIGASPEMRRLYPIFERLAGTHVPVLIEGETGTGKEVLAESLHDASPRASGPFVVFDCTTISASLLEAELFGHERGAFTGAVNARAGLFEQAHQGTLFIDEIGDLDLPLQAKLLRAIERSEVRRVGGNQWTKVDVRIVAATRRDLDREVQARRFRDDLFYRLASRASSFRRCDAATATFLSSPRASGSSSAAKATCCPKRSNVSRPTTGRANSASSTTPSRASCAR